jgi:transcription elongation factor Elf1
MNQKTVTLDFGCPMCQEPTQTGFALKPVTLQRSQDEPVDFECPHCGSLGHYQFRQGEESEYIQWCIEGRMSFKYVYDCPKCGGRLSEYVNIGRSRDHSVCRRCGNVREGNLATVVDVTPWVPK